MGPSGSGKTHAAQPDRRARPPDLGLGRGRRRAHRPALGRQAGPVARAPRRLRLPVLQPAAGADRGAQRRAAAAADPPLQGAAQAARGHRARRRRARRPRRTTIRASSRAARSSASASPAPSSPIRRCCSATSPPATSTASRATRSSTSSRRSTASTARPSSWSPTTRTRRRAPRRTLHLDKGSSRAGGGGMKFFPLIWSNLKRRKVRTLFTLLSILVAFFLFGYLAAIRMAFTHGRRRAARTGCRPSTRSRSSSRCRSPTCDRIAAVPGRGGRHPRSTGSAASTRIPRTSSARWRSTPTTFLELYPEYRAAEGPEGGLAGGPHRRHRRPVTADSFGWKVGDKIPIQGTIYRKQDGNHALGVQHRRHLRRGARRGPTPRPSSSTTTT